MLHVHLESLSGGPTRGGGLAVVHRDNLVVRTSSLQGECRSSTFELQLVEVRTDGGFIIVANIYRSPTQALGASFFGELTDLLANILTKSSKHLLITGDLNCSEPNPNNADDRQTSVFELFGFAQMVRELTRGSNLLHVLACMEGDSFVENVSIDNAGCLSIHRMVLAQLNLGWRRHQPVTFSYRRVREIDFPVFESNLRASSLFINPSASADGYVVQLENVLTTELGKVAPLKTVTRRSTGKPSPKKRSKQR